MGSHPGDDPFDPAAPDPWDQYLDKKTRLDTCFAMVNEVLQTLIDISNEQQWDEPVGQAILDGYRKFCPLLADAPPTNAPPTRLEVSQAAEILVWVAWAIQLEWKYWNEQYNYIEFLFSTSRSTFSDTDDDLINAMRAIQNVNEFRPVLDRVKSLIGGYASIHIPDKWRIIFREKGMDGYYAEEIIDLRMFKYLPIKSYIPGVVDVLNRFKNTDLQQMLTVISWHNVNPWLSSLDDTLDIKPYFKRKTP
jgi:hypothetical protein